MKVKEQAELEATIANLQAEIEHIQNQQYVVAFNYETSNVELFPYDPDAEAEGEYDNYHWMALNKEKLAILAQDIIDILHKG